MTIVDDGVHWRAMPRPSVPPPPRNWDDLLIGHDDGLWYLIKTYDTSHSARQVAYRQRQRKPRWEIRHGLAERGWGVWARNLDGPRVGEDE